MLQAPQFDGLSLDPFSLKQNGLPACEVDVRRGDIVEALADILRAILLSGQRRVSLATFSAAGLVDPILVYVQGVHLARLNGTAGQALWLWCGFYLHSP